MNDEDVKNTQEIVAMLNAQKKNFFQQLQIVETYQSSVNIDALKEAYAVIKQYYDNIASLTKWLANALNL